MVRVARLDLCRDALQKQSGNKTNALRYNTANGAAIDLSDNLIDNGSDCGFQLTRLQIRGKVRVLTTAANLGKIDQSIIYGASISGTHIVEAVPPVSNCLIYTNVNVHGIFTTGASSTTTLQDCTIACVANGTSNFGVAPIYDTPPCKNVVVSGFNLDYINTAGTSSNNATDKSSFGGTGFGGSGQVSVVPATEYVSVTDGSEDFRVASGSVKLKANGTASGTPSTDILGQTRSGSTPTIGAFEVIGGGGGGSDLTHGGMLPGGAL